MQSMDSETSTIPLGLYPGAVVWYFPFFWGGRFGKQSCLTSSRYHEHLCQNIEVFPVLPFCRIEL